MKACSKQNLEGWSSFLNPNFRGCNVSVPSFYWGLSSNRMDLREWDIDVYAKPETDINVSWLNTYMYVCIRFFK